MKKEIRQIFYNSLGKIFDLMSSGRTIHFFEQVDDRIQAIEGLLVPGQEKWLFEAARDLPDKSIILEIGGYKGRSSCSLGYACMGTNKHVYTIDTFAGNDSDFRGPGRNDFFDEWKKNVGECGLSSYITPLKGASRDIAKTWDRPVNFLFIDGSHVYEDVLADFENFFPFVVRGGVVAFHDVEPQHQGPYRVWHDTAEPVLAGTGSCSTIAYGRKKQG